MRSTRLTTSGTNRATPGALSALALAGALVLGACSTDGGGQEGTGTATSAPDAASSTAGDEAAATDDAAGEGDAAGATVDVDALPDPVAEVNGEPISRADFVEIFEQERAASQQQAQAGGAPVDEVALQEGILESLVGSALLTQEGERLGLEASDEQIDAELDSIAEENGLGSRDELVSLLAEQGVDEEQVREEAARLVLIDGVVAERGEVEPPTDEELQAYYDELTGGADAAAATAGEQGGMPAFEDVKEQLAAQVTQERENEAIGAILEDLEAEAEITRHL